MRQNCSRPNLVAQVIAFMPDSPNNTDSAGANSLPEYIAHYRILRRLGKGGMGEVFLGEDTKQHSRKVALKVLPQELTRSESRLRRFKQEARAILALSHPNILGTSATRKAFATAWIISNAPGAR